MAEVFSKKERISLQSALVHAIEYEESYIDSHRTAYASGKEAYLKQKVVPKENRYIVREAQKRIDKWSLLLVKIKSHTAKTK